MSGDSGEETGALVRVAPAESGARARTIEDRLPHPDKVYAWLEKLVSWMDDAFTVPGTNFKFGLDAILGAFPVVGDIATGVVSLSVLYVAVRERIPRKVIVQMIINWGADLLIGAIPVGGDIFDVLFKANRRNFELLKAHRKREPSMIDAGVATANTQSASTGVSPASSRARPIVDDELKTSLGLALGVMGVIAVVAIGVAVAIGYGLVKLIGALVAGG